MTGDTMRHLPTNDGDNGSGSHVERDGQRMAKSYTVQNENEIMEGETLKSSHGRSVGRSCLLQQKMQECMDIVAAVNGEVDKAERDYRRTRNHLTQIQMNVNRFHGVLGEMEEKESTIAGVIKDLEMRMQQGGCCICELPWYFMLCVLPWYFMLCVLPWYFMLCVLPWYFMLCVLQ